MHDFYHSKLLIDTSCVKHNIEYLRNIHNRHTRIMAILKANAYGTDPVKMAKLLD